MDVTRADPRGTEWEQPHPVYRVYFWDRAPVPPGVDPERAGWRSDEWRVTGAEDVHEVLAWATGRVGHDRQFELFVEGDGLPRHGLVRLAGNDPTSSG